MIDGRAELTIEDQTIRLEPGDSWLVPATAEHRYRILERFTAVEATSPPAQVHARDEAAASEAARPFDPLKSPVLLSSSMTLEEDPRSRAPLAAPRRPPLP